MGHRRRHPARCLVHVAQPVSLVDDDKAAVRADRSDDALDRAFVEQVAVGLFG